MDYLGVTTKIAFFVCTMQVFSAFFDLKYYAPFIEIFRCVGVLTFYGVKFFDVHGVLPNRIFMTILFAVFLIFWIGFLIIQVNLKF